MGARPCSGKWKLFLDPDVRETRSAKEERVAAAKAICTRCPEEIECLAGALQRRDKQDIYGGLTADERLPIMELLDEAGDRGGEAVSVGS